MKFPKKPISEVQALERIREITEEDGLIRNIQGAVFGMVVEPPSLALKLYTDFLGTNYAYQSMVYPGIVRLEKEAISMLADFCGLEGATGDIVAGGTMANTMALKAARDKSKKKNLNVVLPDTAHPSFSQACQD